MKQVYTTVILSFIAASCATKISYLGGTFTATKNVDVYVDPSAIKKPYTIVGKGYVEYGLYRRLTIGKLQKKAIEQARMNGADAVLFQDYYVRQDGTSIHGVTKSDSVGESDVTVTNGAIGPVIYQDRKILFLKYERSAGK